jgi:hypothetical protein
MINLCKNIDEVHSMMAKGYSINEQDRFGQTLLHKAVIFGTVRFVEELLKAGANTRIKNQIGRTPIFYLSKNREEILNLLLEYGGPEIFTDFDNENKNYYSYHPQ